MRLTFHGTLLGIILLLLAMMAIGPARQLWAEHQQIRSDEATLAAGNADAAKLTARIQAMQDPKHVEQLARDQLGYVRPGETSYIIVHPLPATPPPAPKKPHVSWVRLAWTGVRAWAFPR
jgi:cell division protein FtsB